MKKYYSHLGFTKGTEKYWFIFDESPESEKRLLETFIDYAKNPELNFNF